MKRVPPSSRALALSRAVSAGDVAYIPAGERHWHGAKAGSDMTHLAVLGSGKTFIVADDRPAD